MGAMDGGKIAQEAYARFEYVPRNNMSGGERENIGEREAPKPNSSYGPSFVRWLIIDYDVCRVGNSSSVNR